jgi:metal-responsive CopG/Arc/MetJ family transcriptional regulator
VIKRWEVLFLSKRICVDLPTELFERMGEVIEFFDFSCEEEFVKAAVRRRLDEYTVLIRVAAKSR